MSRKNIFGLYGAGGFARETMPVVLENVRNRSFGGGVSVDEVVFIETNPSAREVNGIRILSEREFLDSDFDRKYFNVAVADSFSRARLSEAMVQNDAIPLSIISKNSIDYGFNELSAGAIVCANTIITSNVTIGKFFHANIYSYIAHDCVIGDFVTLAPRVNCNGNVEIGSFAYIGTSAVIRQGELGRPLVIGEGAVVGMGAVVTKDVPPNTTVVGNPARILERKY